MRSGEEDRFSPNLPATVFYPVEGGMSDMIRASGVDRKVRFVTVSGLQNLRRYLGAFSGEPGGPCVP